MTVVRAVTTETAGSTDTATRGGWGATVGGSVGGGSGRSRASGSGNTVGGATTGGAGGAGRSSFGAYRGLVNGLYGPDAGTGVEYPPAAGGVVGLAAAVHCVGRTGEAFGATVFTVSILAGTVYLAPVVRSCRSASGSPPAEAVTRSTFTRRSGWPAVRNVITSPARGPSVAPGGDETAGGATETGAGGDCPAENPAQAAATAPAHAHRVMPGLRADHRARRSVPGGTSVSAGYIGHAGSRG